MDKVLKLAKELVATIEEEWQKNKVMLKDIPAGGKFDTGIGRFIVLKQARNCKPIKCVDTGVVYSSCKEASDLTGINVGSINHVITGIAKTAGGMRWERV